MAGHAQLKFVMTECSKTQIRLTGPILSEFRRLKCYLNINIANIMDEMTRTAENFIPYCTHSKKSTRRFQYTSHLDTSWTICVCPSSEESPTSDETDRMDENEDSNQQQVIDVAVYGVCKTS